MSKALWEVAVAEDKKAPFGHGLVRGNGYDGVFGDTSCVETFAWADLVLWEWSWKLSYLWFSFILFVKREIYLWKKPHDQESSSKL